MTTKQTVVFKASNFSGHLSPSAKAEVNNLKGTIFYNGLEEKGAPKNDKEKDDFQDINVRKKKKKKNHHKNMDKSLLLKLNAMKMGYFELLSKSIGPVRPVQKSFYKRLCLYSHQVLEGESSLLKSEWVFYMYNKGGGAWTDLSLVKSFLTKGLNKEQVQDLAMRGRVPDFFDRRTPSPALNAITANNGANRYDIARTSGSLPDRDAPQFGPDIPHPGYPSGRQTTFRPAADEFGQTGYRTKKRTVREKKKTPTIEDVLPQIFEERGSHAVSEDLPVQPTGIAAPARGEKDGTGQKFQPTQRQQEDASEVLQAIRDGRQVGPIDARTRKILEEGWTAQTGGGRAVVRRPPVGRTEIASSRKTPTQFRAATAALGLPKEMSMNRGEEKIVTPYISPKEAYESYEASSGTPVPVSLGGEVPKAHSALGKEMEREISSVKEKTMPLKAKLNALEQWPKILKKIEDEIATQHKPGTKEYKAALRDALGNTERLVSMGESHMAEMRASAPAPAPALAPAPASAPARASTRASARASAPAPAPASAPVSASAPATAVDLTKIPLSRMIDTYWEMAARGEIGTLDTKGNPVGPKAFYGMMGLRSKLGKLHKRDIDAGEDRVHTFTRISKGWSNTMRTEQTQKGTYFAKSGPFPHRMYVEAHVENDRNDAPSTYVAEKNLVKLMVKSMGIPEYEVKRRLAKIDKSVYSEG